MEDSDLEPLASEITIRPTARPGKGLWSSRSVGAASKSAAPTTAEVWSQALKQAGFSKPVYSLLAEFRTGIEEGRFVQSLAAYREAANLSRTEKALKDACFEHALKEIKALTANNWRVAAALLDEASRIDGVRAIAPEIRAEIERSEREETIANTLAELKPGGDAEQSYTRLSRALGKYPGNAVLEGHLTGVCAAVVAKRGATERNRRLANMASLKNDFDQSTDQAEAAKLVELSRSALGPYRSDPEIVAMFDELQWCEKACREAQAAFATGQVAHCLQVCSRVLYQTPQQQALLALRQSAREFLYADEGAALSQLRELLENGPLAEAQAVCTQLKLQFPDAPDVLNLDGAIRDKEAAVYNLLKEAEACLLQRDVEAAGVLFTSAQRLLPLDVDLGTHTATLLYGHARSEIDQDWREFDAALELIDRMQPDRPLPVDLAAVLQRRKEHAENVRQHAEAIHKIAERGLQADALRESAVLKPPTHGKLKASTSGADSTLHVPAADDETPIVTAGVVEISRHAPARWLDKTTIGVLSAVAATLLCAALLAWHDHQTRVGKKTPPVIAAVEPAKPLVSQPVPNERAVAAENSESSGTQMATLEIRGAEPGTEVKVDNVLLGAAVPGNSLSRELSSGDHVVELSREGFSSKRMALHFAPGEVALLTGSNVQLQSTDAIEVDAERRDWNHATQMAKVASLEDFIRKYPASTYASEAKARIRDLQWQSVDKSDPAAMLAFAARYPSHPAVAQARELAQSLNRQNALRAEQSDWLSLNKSNKAALASFAARYPNGAHAGIANSLIADLDRGESGQAVAANPRSEDTHRLEAANTVARIDTPLREEHRLPVIVPAVPDPAVLESAAVLDVIGRFANAWNTKDYRSLVAIEPDLKRRDLKAQLSPVKAVVMRISPVAPPQISGTQATIVCRRQANETFSDGSLKQNPESIVTYVLSKRNGTWGIEAIR